MKHTATPSLPCSGHGWAGRGAGILEQSISSALGVCRQTENKKDHPKLLCGPSYV